MWIYFKKAIQHCIAVWYNTEGCDINVGILIPCFAKDSQPNPQAEITQAWNQAQTRKVISFPWQGLTSERTGLHSLAMTHTRAYAMIHIRIRMLRKDSHSNS